MKKVLVALLVLSIFGCGPPGDHLTKYQKTETYPIQGDFHEPVASVVVDRDGRFDVNALMGSAWLRDKQRGIFITANHVIKLETNYKLFFCGHVYVAERMLDTGVTDVGFLRITSKFDPNDFPEPYPLGELAEVGDNVFIRGIHMHPKELQDGKIIHLISSEYYGISNLKDSREFVYDNLPAMIVKKEVPKPGEPEPEISEEDRLYLIRNHPVPMKAKNDHKMSFGGLSGGPTVNERGQVVGMNVIEHGNEGDYILDEDGIKYRPRVTLEILSIEEIMRALSRMGVTAQ